jgi:hypothetical protein
VKRKMKTTMGSTELHYKNGRGLVGRGKKKGEGAQASRGPRKVSSSSSSSRKAKELIKVCAELGWVNGMLDEWGRQQ